LPVCRVSVGQFASAAGALASLDGKGLEVQAALMAELGLGVPHRESLRQANTTVGPR